jgi:hypothetical protein
MAHWISKLYWQGCAFALAAEGLGLHWGAQLALALCAMQVAHAFARHRRPGALPVQVRLVFLMLFAVGAAAPALAWLHGLLFLGVNVLLVADYCVLARTLTLLPWNRSAALSPALIRAVFTLPPGPGSVAERLRIAPARER